MAVAFVKNHAVASAKAAGTTLAITLDTAVPAGNLIVLRMVFDNAATANKPIISSIGVAAGETATWGLLWGISSSSTTAGAFSSGTMWGIRTTVAWPAASYTVTLDTSTVQKAGFFQEFSGVLATKRTTGVTGTQYSTTTTAASVSTSSSGLAVGDLAIGFIFGSNVAAAQAGDTDTTGGAWSTPFGVGSTGGNVNTNNFGVGQYKILTAASEQTLNNSAAMTAGNGAICCILAQYVPPSITQAAYQFFDDAGTESGAASLAAVNTPVTGDITNGDGIGALRIRLQNTTALAGSPADDYQLQWEKNATNVWTNVVSSGAALSDQYSEDNYGTSTIIGSGTTSEAGQSFLGNGAPLARAGFWLMRTGNPTFSLEARLYAHTGTFGAGGTGTGSPLATSTTSIAASTVSTATRAWYDFNFLEVVTLSEGTPYVIVLAVVGAGDASNNIQLGLQATGTHPGNSVSFISGWVGNSGGVDDLFRVYTTPRFVFPYDNPNLTGTGPTTNRLGAGTGSFQTGEVCEDGVVNDLALSASNYTEILYSLKVVAAQVAHGDTLRFRILRNGLTTGVTYSQTPTLNIIRSAVDVAATITTVWSSSAEIEALLDFYDETNSNTVVPIYDDASLTGIGQSFLGGVGKLSKVSWWMQNGGTSTGNAIARLYAHSGSFGAGDSVPTGAALASSAPFDTLGSTTTLHWQDFIFDGTYTMGLTPYVVTIEMATNLGSSKVGTDTTSPAHPGNASAKNPGWVSAAVDHCFKVYALVSGGAATGWVAAATGTVEAPAGNNWPATITSDWGGWDAQAAATVATPVISINGLRFFNDDGALTASTALAADNASLSLLDADKPMQLRVQLVNQTSISINWNITLQCSINGGTFNSFSSGIGISAAGGSPNFATLDPVTTSRIGGGIGAFSNGSSNEAGTSVTIAIPANSYTEYVWFGLMEAADLAVSDVITFRLLKSPGSIVLPTLVTLPSITVIPPGPVDHPGTITTGWGTWTATAAGTVVAEEILATASATWGVWTATAAGTVTAEVITATITTSWGTWTATSTAIRLAYAGISTSWGTWASSATGTISTPVGWSIPPNVVATTTGQTTITVTWDAVPAATGYDVERNGTIVVMDHPASPYNDTGLSPDTPYNYRVRAVG